MALAVPLSRFTSRVGGGSAFFVRPHCVFIAMILFPKRTIPGLAFATFAMFIGVGTGFVASVPFFHPKNFQTYHLLFPFAFIAASWYVRRLWRTTDKSARVIEMAPRDLAMMLGIFLAIGVIVGFLLAQPSVQNA